MHLIVVSEGAEGADAKRKQYRVNTVHPLFQPLRNIILRYVGVDQIVEQVIEKLGNLNKVYLTGDLARGQNASFIDLVIVGVVDKSYLYQLVDKAETLIGKKIRVALFAPDEFTEDHLAELGPVLDLVEG